MLPAPIDKDARFCQRTEIRPRVAYTPDETPTVAEQIALGIIAFVLLAAVAVWYGVGG